MDLHTVLNARRWWFALAGAIGWCVAVWVVMAGCGGMSSIDRRVDRVLEARSGALGAGAVAPRGEYESAGETQDAGQYRTTPPTMNPEAEALQYSTASADRDVAAKLRTYAAIAEGALTLDLRAALGVAQATSREYRNAEEDYILAAIRLLIERHRWSPRFFDDLSASVSGDLESGTETALTVMNELRVTQRLPYGGEVEARLVTRATEQLRTSVTEDYVTSSSLVLEANIPLLRNAGLVAREDLIQAERDVVYAARDFERFRREFLVSIARDYFDLVAQLATVRNQERSLESRQLSYDRAQARVEAGKDPASDARQLQSDVLSAESRLINIREAYILALDRFKIRLGIPVETPVLIEPFVLELPEPAATPDDAARFALTYRLDLQNQRDFIDDARRDVQIAHNQLLPDLDFTASYTAGTDPGDPTGGLGLRFEDGEYLAGVTFGLPLDREIERLNLRASMLGLNQEVRRYETFRDNVILEARRQRRQIDQQRLNLRLAEETVETNRLRLEEQVVREAEANRISESQDDLLEATNSLDAALRDLRTSILDYLLSTGQIRISGDGFFQTLPGMATLEAGEPGGEGDGPNTPEGAS